MWKHWRKVKVADLIHVKRIAPPPPNGSVEFIQMQYYEYLSWIQKKIGLFSTQIITPYVKG